MPLIIAATDFTEVAQNAVKYACTLAKEQHAQVLIMHSYSIPVMFSDIPVPSTLVTDAEDDATAQMKVLVADMTKSFPGLDVKGKVVYGYAVDILDDYESQTKPMLIVVGNSLAGDDTTWLESTMREEFKQLHSPVIAIPLHMAYKPVQKICFAFDNKHTGNDVAFGQLTSLVTALKAELHVLTVNRGTESNNDIDPEAKKRLSVASPQYHVVSDAGDIDGAIVNFAEKNGMDWLVMIPRKHSFFEGLFHKSHTKAATRDTSIPIMALHEG